MTNHKPNQPIHIQPARLLVVDDEPNIADVLKEQIVHSTGSYVDIAYSGEEALERLETSLTEGAERYDLMILDMRMPPGMDGRAVLDWVRGHPTLCYTRIIILTATAIPRERIAALSAGADDYITKPYHPPEMLARVTTMLRSHQSEKQLQQQQQQLAALNQVSLAMTALRDTQEVFAIAVGGVRDVLHVEAAAIFMHQRKVDLLKCRQFNSIHTPFNYEPLHIEQGMIGQSFTQKKLLCFNAPQEETIFVAKVDSPTNITVSNIITAPLIVRSRSVGVLLALNQTTGGFSDVDRDLFSSLANSVARAIENAWLFKNAREQHDRLLESRNRLQVIIDGIPHSIYTVDKNWQLLVVNQNKAQELDTTSEHLVRQTCYQAFFARTEPCDHCQVRKALQQQTDYHWTVRWWDDDQLPREWDVNAYPIPGKKDNVPQAVVVWEDITEERRLEYSLMQAGKLAAIGQLAAGVAHEINNPMAVINASSAMLKLEIKEEDDRFELVDLIQKAGDRASKVVRNLLDFARQEEYEFEPIDINESIKQSLHLVSYQLQSANINVINDLDPDLPPIFASSEHLKTVWINLIVNARDAVSERANDAEIEVRTRFLAEEDCVRVMVRDNGAGMSEAQVSHIFEPFYTTKDPGEGTGLGLSTSHRIVEQHGGEMEVVSVLGEGTTFIVRLPIGLA